MTDLIIDITEFKFLRSAIFEVNLLILSNYENATTGKTFISIVPHAMGILFGDIYPESSADSHITAY